MIDLHAHTFFSDGILSPSELVYRAKCKGYAVVALTDHVDYSNMEFVIPKMVKVAKILTENYGIIVVPGVELTYVPPKLIESAAGRCRKLGSKVVVVHGETVAESVPPGTNMSAVEAGVDILAHPGHLSEEEASIAAKNDVKIEITTRRWHRVTNKEVAQVAFKMKSKLVLNTDSHTPDDFLTIDLIAQVLIDAGLSNDYYDVMQKNSQEIVDRVQCKSTCERG
ncbi:MAG: histidinol phosphate phosphatase domain-containing protein [Endomicrobium sp.]|jgi:histidinol phosphatase-like PHP family hydrolase|nr:histidinol phosphate phosphatase domain-containing protein [Endomicrobium sp.]